MSLLGSLRAIDIEPNAQAEDYGNYKLRKAGRLIVFDGQKVALLHVSKHHYYMLPGGGLDSEDIQIALQREALEELGCTIETDREIGTIEIYLDRWHKKQVDRCFIAHTVGPPQQRVPTAFEHEEGHEVIWTESLAAAIELIAEAQPTDLNAKLIRARDLLFLQTAQQTLR